MTLFQDNLSPYLTEVEQGSAPANPASGNQKLYLDSGTHHLRRVNSSGVVVDIETASGGYTQGAFVYNSVAESTANGNGTTITWDTEISDTDTIHDTVTNTSRLTCKTAGVYLVVGQIIFPSNATGYRQAYIQHTRSATISYFGMQNTNALNGTLTYINVSARIDMQVNDYVELIALQSSGGALNVNGGAPTAPGSSFSMQRIG